MEKDTPTRTRTAVLVHCVHGQSRSCAVCIAYLIHMCTSCAVQRELGPEENNIPTTAPTTTTFLHKCHDIVASARPTMAINPGFMRQLELFRKMKSYKRNKVAQVHEPVPLSKAHSDFRCFRSKAEFYDNGVVSKFFTLATCIDYSNSSGRPNVNVDYYRCGKCRTILFSNHNLVTNWSQEDASNLPSSDYWASSAGGRSYELYKSSSTRTTRDSYSNPCFGHMDMCLKVEPMDWMKACMTYPNGSLECRGVITCPLCKDSHTLGHWDFDNPDPSTLIIIKLSKVCKDSKGAYSVHR